MKKVPLKKLTIGYLNLNSIKNKFEFLEYVINEKLDIILLSERKLDDSFP